MKKTLSKIIIIIVIFTLIFPTFTFAEKSKFEDIKLEQQDYDLIAEGKAEITTSDGSTVTSSIDHKDSNTKSTVNILIKIVNFLPSIARLVMDLIVEDTFYIQKLVFGEFDLFDVDYFDTSNVIITGGVDGSFEWIENVVNNFIDSGTTNLVLKSNVAKWFYAMRNIALVGSLLILFYVAIRMAISTIAEDKARYKKMLVSWLSSVAIIFILPYIMIFITTASELLVNLLKEIAETANFFDTNVEETIISEMTTTNAKGFSLLIPSITYWVLVFYQIKFFIMYMKRLLVTGFLIVIAPLITVLYPIDKMKDNKSQTLSKWIKEYAINVLIQPLHAFLYLFFMITAMEIANRAPLLVIVFLMGISRGERVIRNIFRIKELSSIQEISKTASFKDMGKALKGVSK